jgi:uncharacterized protein YjbI with pentapeptide repeats
MPTMSRDEVLRRVARNERLDRADLKGIDLSHGKLARAVLDRTDLDGANLEGANLEQASLRRTSLREAYLVGANLAGANLENADLEGAKLERANLAGANLTRASLEGAVLTGANLSNARLSYAQLASAKLGGANLAGADLTHAELDEAYLGGILAGAVRLTSANMRGANLEDAKLPNANLDDAILQGACARNADFTGASLVKTNLSGADLSSANLADADLRFATFFRAVLTGARFTGAKAAGIVGTGAPVVIDTAWLDLSPAGDGSQRVENGVIPALFAGGAMALVAPTAGDRAHRRYFGRGDVLRNATLQFDAGARVEIDSLFHDCTIHVGEETELVVGPEGVLADCEIVGAGNVTIHGKFFERKSPGIVGPRQLVVSASGAVVSSVAQNPQSTRFGFERGCQLRVKIVPPSGRPMEGPR